MTRAAIPDCPHCRSTHVTTTNLARKSAVMLGGLAGGISSAATVWNGARIGATLGSAAGPAGAMLSAVAGAVLAALAGAAAGCAAGGVVGDLIDHKVLNNYRCLGCGYRFSRSSLVNGDVSLSEGSRMPSRADGGHPVYPSFFTSQGHGPCWPSEDMDEDHPYGFCGPNPHPHLHPSHAATQG